MKPKYTIALYLRLSQEDEKLGESESIANQRNLLNDYIFINPSLQNCAVHEFVDDGFSGTNFDRPSVKNMLDAVKNGEINCIIVKDFSRFGRNFIEVSDYIEQIFPFLGVRFIAINNNFDSNKSSSAGSLDVAFKNLVNDLYSKDISKKIKSAKKTKMLKGDFISNQAPLGYAKSPEDKNKLIIDPVSAEYVKLIFNLFLNKNSTTIIAEKLNTLNIPTPLDYRRSKGQRKKWNIIGEKCFWARITVLRILKDERYTGKYVGGKSQKVKVGSNKAVKIPKSNWITLSNNHESIISEEVFAQAQKIIGTKAEHTGVTRIEHLLSKKIYCGYCKHAMRRRGASNPYFYCETPQYTQCDCSCDKVPEKHVFDILLLAIKKHVQLAFSLTELFEGFLQKTKQKKATIMQEMASLKELLEKEKLSKIKLYESYKEDLLEKEQYLCQKAKLDDKIAIILLNSKKLEFSLNGYNGKTDNDFIDTFSKYQSNLELSKQMIDDLVSAVYIYNFDSIEIVWNFADDYKKAMHILELDSN